MSNHEKNVDWHALLLVDLLFILLVTVGYNCMLSSHYHNILFHNNFMQFYNICKCKY